MRILVGVRIVAHFDDVTQAVFVVGHRHGTRDQRLRGNQVHREPVFDAQRLRNIGRLDRRKTGKLFLG